MTREKWMKPILKSVSCPFQRFARAVGLILALLGAQELVVVHAAEPDPPANTKNKSSLKSIHKDLVRDAVELAKAASKNAYCPYSKFKVGAVIVHDDGTLDAGCNVENASYGLTVCAERNAVFQGVAKGRRSIQLVVVYTPTKKPTAPCGACRQVLNEFGPRASVLCVCDSDEVIESTVAELLPQAFGPKNLEKW